jgi:hypothetical protein
MELEGGGGAGFLDRRWGDFDEAGYIGFRGPIVEYTNAERYKRR